MVQVWTPDTAETIFKDGAHNRKIGGDVLVGDLRGAYMVTLSLEERRTCPTTCSMWNTCYGNRMHQARRWAFTDDLMRGIEAEIGHLCGRYPGVVVRLHVLGDFPSIEYLDLWERLLRRHPNLFCFGFTAHRRATVGGERIAQMRGAFPGPYGVRSRFAIRHSDTTGTWGGQSLMMKLENAKPGT